MRALVPLLTLGLVGLPAVGAAQAPLPPNKPSGAARMDHDTKVQSAGALPEGWMARPDEGPANFKMETMPPGWHLTMGGAAIIYRGQDRARPPFSVSAKLHLFPGRGDHQEAFGLFIGGQALDGAGQKYTYFLIRGDGKFKIKRRNGARAEDVTPWAGSAAIVQAGKDGPVVNVLGIEATADRVRFLVNGTEVWSGSAKEVDANGIVGLRMNHNLSVHVESLELRKG